MLIFFSLIIIFYMFVKFKIKVRLKTFTLSHLILDFHYSKMFGSKGIKTTNPFIFGISSNPTKFVYSLKFFLFFKTHETILLNFFLNEKVIQIYCFDQNLNAILLDLCCVLKFFIDIKFNKRIFKKSKFSAILI